MFGYPTVWYGNQDEFRDFDGLPKFLFTSVLKKSNDGKKSQLELFANEHEREMIRFRNMYANFAKGRI